MVTYNEYVHKSKYDISNHKVFSDKIQFYYVVEGLFKN